MRCPFCNVIFNPIYSWQKYCSLKCRSNTRVAIVRKWRREHKEEYAESRKGEYNKWDTSRQLKQLERAKKYGKTLRGKLTRLNLHVKHRGQSDSIIKYDEFITKFGSGNWKCAQCGETEDLTFDHIKAFTHGGKHEINNIQILCRSCNSTKGCYERYARI